VLGKPLALGVGHLADDQGAGLNLLLHPLELRLALFGLALTLRLGRHGTDLPAHGAGHAG
jgi:hypothetical protein